VPSVDELSALYANFLIAPRHGPGVCRVCLNLTDGWRCCYACAHGGRWLDAVAPVSYSVAGEQLHHALAGYKRAAAPVARELALGLASILWRWLASHECCVARAAGIDTFPLVTTVPSCDPRHARRQPLHALVAELVAPIGDRLQQLLERSPAEVEPHRFSRERYLARQALDGQAVLLVDDTWTTGANAQSAAAALKAAGSGPVAAVVIGRHINRGWGENDRRLRELQRPFDWGHCVLCADRRSSQAAGAG